MFRIQFAIVGLAMVAFLGCSQETQDRSVGLSAEYLHCAEGHTGDSCVDNNDCCSDSCKGKKGRKTCKGDDGSGSGGTGGGTPDAGTPDAGSCSYDGPLGEPSDCIDCAISSCETYVVAAFGANYASGDYSGGLCETSANCATACGTDCVPTAECEEAVTAIGICVGLLCSTECSPPDPDVCELEPVGASCVSGDQCCSGNCKGKKGSRTCKE